MNRTPKVRATLVALLATFALVVAACSDDDSSNEAGGAETPTDGGSAAPDPGDADSDLVEAAQAEGKVVLYSAYNAELSQEIADAFKDEYGITVEVVRQASADLNARYAAEAEAGAVVADVLWQPDDVFATAAEENGWFSPLDPTDVPGLDRVPADAVTDTAVSVLIQPWGIAYNTNLVSGDAVPESWSDLVEGEQIEGGLLVAAPGNSVATAAVYNFWLNEFGEEFFSGLRQAQRVSIGDSVSNAIQQVGAGEAGAFVPAPLSTVATAQAAGAPVDVVIPDKTTGFAMMASISTDAPSPNAARLLVSFLLSEAGQAIAVADIAIPVIDSVDSAVDRPTGYVPSDNAQTAERLRELSDLVTG